MEEKKEFNPPEVDFTFFVTTLAIQASIAMGQMPNPQTNKAEVNLEQARFLIDTIAMLKEKTAGNLNAEEDKLVDNLLYELRTVYLGKSGGEKK